MNALIKIVVLSVASMLILQSGSMAQSYVGGSGMVNAGYMWTPALSSSLRSMTNNSVAFAKGYPIIGAELNYRNGSYVVAVSGYIGMQKATRTGNEVAEPFIWKAHGGFGWIIVSAKSLFIYPVVGIGGMESSVLYHHHGHFDSNNRFIVRSASFDCSIHADYFLNPDTKEGGAFNVGILGARLGYSRGFSPGQLQGWSLSISFSGFAFMKHKQPVKK